MSAKRSPSYAKMRVFSLVAVHVLILLHILHWKLNGRTLAPLELNELMYTLEAGIITAGFLFMVLVCLSVVVFGRFFCSWGCHILALQDSCAWLMDKLGVRPRIVRAKGLLLVPLGAMLFMFVWPQIQFLWFDRLRPVLHTAGEESGWASFITSDFWRNLPPPGVALLTFAFCGFAFVALMGDRAFCKFACPYGAIFAILERFAPGRISKTGDCTACGLCTAACNSDIQVHEELATYGQVVNSACLRDLDCLNACPDAAIGFRFRKPPGFGKSMLEGAKPVSARASMFTRGEELWMALAYVPLVWVLRGLYGLIPLLLSFALAGMLVYLGVIAKRLIFDDSVKLVRARIKSKGRLRSGGRLVLIACFLLATLLVHSAAIQWQTGRFHRALSNLAESPSAVQIREGLDALAFLSSWELMPTSASVQGAGQLYRAQGTLLADAGDFPAALVAYERAAQSLSNDPVLHFNLGRLLSQVGRNAEAIEHYEASIALDPDDPESRNNLAYMLLQSGRPTDAQTHLLRALELKPNYANAHFLFGRMLYETGRVGEAMGSFRRAAQLDAGMAQWFEQFEREEAGLNRQR